MAAWKGGQQAGMPALRVTSLASEHLFDTGHVGETMLDWINHVADSEVGRATRGERGI